MTCPSCQRDNAADAAFCSQCGNRLGDVCSDCGRPVAADAVFCSGCGLRVGAQPEPSPPARPATPEHLVEKVRASRPALEGERKQVTVLFADVKGSMDLQEDLDPEEWHGVMDRFMRILSDGIHRFEGTVDKFTGDGIMALFGAPVAHEDHARRACYAALHLADTLGHYAEELRRTKGLSFHARIGLNSGEVVVGAIGDFRQIIQRRSERETVVILLEDLHWFDPASEEFLEMLVESYPGTRTLVITNFRPEFQAGWMRHSYYRQLPLAALGPAAVRQLLADLLGTHPSLQQLSDHIVERTGGNPFFVEEVVRTLIEEGTLGGSPADYRLTCRLEDLRVPPTVQSLLSARIDRLAANDKQVLQTAAVVGRIFSEPVLQRVTQLNGDVGSSLRALHAAEFIQEESLYPVAEYRFWHPLTQEVAYGSLLGERRSRIHAAVARRGAQADGDAGQSGPGRGAELERLARLRDADQEPHGRLPAEERVGLARLLS